MEKRASVKLSKLKERRIKGVSLSSGIAIGNLFITSSAQTKIIPEFSITASDVEREINRYRKAIECSRKDLHNLQSFLAHEGSSEAVTIIDTHIQMLEDPFMTTMMEDKIRICLKNTESVFRSVMTDYERQFSQISDTFFEQRLLDVKDLTQRILRHLYPEKVKKEAVFPDNSIVYGKELIPTDIAEASSLEVAAFLSQSGGDTSHAALIARAKGIPYVADINIRDLKEGLLIVDGKKGVVISNPAPETVEEYRKKLEEQQIETKKLFHEMAKEVFTTDGEKIAFHANIENLDDLELMHDFGADGVGLFRTEFLFMQKDLHLFTEEKQYSIYSEILSRSSGLPVVFRVFDVGGDKGFTDKHETNPALGCRAIRFLLKEKGIFRTQLRALLRASPLGDMHILLPLISDVVELRESKQLIEEVKMGLLSDGISVAESIKIGSMIEVPSAVMTCDIIARESDFLSLGTNDLIQYSMAADRSNQEVNSLYLPVHPSLIRMIQVVVKESGKLSVPLCLCGEMASNPLYTPLLIGLGVRQFSCSPRFIPPLKKMASEISLEESTNIIEKVSGMQTAEEIQAYLLEIYQRRLPEFASF